MAGEKLFRAFFLFCLFSLVKGNIVVDEECLNYKVYPVQYELNIYPYVNADVSHYRCDLIITVIANAPNVTVITLATKDLEIESVNVDDGSRNIIRTVNPYTYVNLSGVLHIYLKESLKIYSAMNKQFYFIRIRFTKYVKEGSQGVFLAKYDDKQHGNHKYLFVTRLSPCRAKYFFPCFDNARFEAVFKFRVFIPKNLPNTNYIYTNTSLVIAEEQRRNSFSGDYTLVEYMPSPQVGLHQVGFHYSQFTSNSAKAHNTNDTLILWAPMNELHYYRFIQNYGIKIINLIHEYAKDRRPLLQGPINLIPVPAKVNGYEIGSWNLLTNGAYRMSYNKNFTSIKQIENMNFELAQQLCRIWLGNPGEVMKTRWREEWFKEGMATYLAYYFLTQYNHGMQTHHRRPLSGYGLQMKHRAMAADWPPINTPALESFNTSLAIEIPSRYKELVTMKTGAIIWMLENWVGSEKFHQALVNYIKSRRGTYISLKDFTLTLDKSTIECLHQFFNGSTASRILDSWFRRRGYPVINVQVLRDRVPNAVMLKQRLFNFTHEHRINTDFLIPISYMVQNNLNCYNCHVPRFTIGAQTYTFGENLNGGWIILNAKGSGYYRVNYDPVTWRLIAKSLKENLTTIDELNRAQIVNDVFALYVAGDLDIQLAMEVLDYLDKETSPVVWESALSGFEMLHIKGADCNMTRHLYKEWEDFMIKKVAPIFGQLTESNNFDHNWRLIRSNVVQLACELNYEPCQWYVKKMNSEKRQHDLFPDCRMSYFYVMNNNLLPNSWVQNPQEQDDKWIADEKFRAMTSFFGSIPIGEQRPMPILMSTTEKTTVAAPEKLQTAGSGASSARYSIMVIFIATLIITNCNY